MNGRRVLLAFSLLGTLACSRPGDVPVAAAYAPANSCAGCHATIAKTYAGTGMGRAFSRFRRDGTAAHFEGRNHFYHKASDFHYRMTMRNGSAYMRRYQVGPDGAERNVVEKRIDYIVGSGHKAQTFLHRTARGELVELPVAWYTEVSGYWAMNPNYDRADHEDFRRRISYDCFFCHNAYPGGVAGDSFFADAVYPKTLPEGIDCQRCHGPASAHVKAAQEGASADVIRAGVVNPERLDRDQRMEICMQCHLQSTSRSLPHAVIRPGRGVFSFRAGEPLGDYVSHFDHARGAGYDDKFEIAHAAYRLRQSACFRSSKMDCTTCHDPHAVTRGAAAVKEASAACRVCHGTVAGSIHAGKNECVSCHMPRRRAEDVVEVVMTDHKIVRRAPRGDLTARRAERDTRPYRGEVVPYYPAKPDRMSVALAQVRTGANLGKGLPELEAEIAALAKTGSCSADCYYDLAEAYGKAGRVADASRAAERALAMDGRHVPTLRSYGAQLSIGGEWKRGAELLERALAVRPGHAATMHDLARNYAQQGRHEDAIRMLREAARADPDAPEIHASLASALESRGDAAGALQAFADAVRADPRHAGSRYGYAVMLAQAGRKREALEEAGKAADLNPSRADSQLLLGMLSAEQGDLARARVCLERAARAPDAAVAARAREVLAAIGSR
ncbi:MAG: tetratricopeptide repeat protein [Bryobacteraceae bacterium]